MSEISNTMKLNMTKKLGTWLSYVHRLPTTDLLGNVDSKHHHLQSNLSLTTSLSFPFQFIDIDMFIQTSEQCSRNSSKQSIRESYL